MGNGSVANRCCCVKPKNKIYCNVCKPSSHSCNPAPTPNACEPLAPLSIEWCIVDSTGEQLLGTLYDDGCSPRPMAIFFNKAGEPAIPVGDWEFCSPPSLPFEVITNDDGEKEIYVAGELVATIPCCVDGEPGPPGPAGPSFRFIDQDGNTIAPVGTDPDGSPIYQITI